MSERAPITREGNDRLRKELEQMIGVERPRAATAIGIARDHGDISENAEYEAAKDAQGMLEARIANLQGQLANCQVVDPAATKSDRVLFGATVRVVDTSTEKEVTYQIVGEPESDLKNGKISYKTPIARHLIGKRVGDLVDIETPGGVRSLEILEILYR